MNRRAAIGFLVLAALVGAVQALDKSVLAALGETLIGAQQAIAADTRYTHVTQVASPGCLWTKVDVVNTYDACDGPTYDYSGYYMGPTVPMDTYYYAEPTAYTSYTGYATDYGSWGYQEVPMTGYSTYGSAQNVLVEYPTYYGTAYNEVYAPSYAGISLDPYGSSYTGSSLSYSSYGTPTYQDTWYTQAFPGIGQALVPLLPPQYQPVGYGATGYSIVAAQPYPTGYYPQQQQQGPAPTCSITLSPSDIRYGGSSVISWVSRDATTASLNDIGAVPLSGSKTINNQTISRTIGLTVARGGQIGACYALLEVAPEGLARPNCIISVYPERIQRGQSASIAWLANNATVASLSGVGTVAREGGRTVSPTQTTKYTLTVGDGASSSTCSATLQVL